MSNSPECPSCGSEMFIWDGKGFHKGKKFWLCTEYTKSCGNVFKKSSIEITDKESVKKYKKQNSQNLDTLTQIAVDWPEAVRRNAWNSFFNTIGSAPSFLQQILSKSNKDINRVISQTNYLIKNDHLRAQKKVSEDTKFLVSILKKILQRGEVPNVTLFTEDELIRKYNLNKFLDTVTDNADLSRTLKSSIFIHDNSLISEFLKKDELVIDSEFDHNGQQNSLWGHESEKNFMSDWIKDRLGPVASAYFIPQASLDGILRSYKDERGFAQRRIDFLFCHPLSQPLAIEIDGSQHKTSSEVDGERDDSLAQVGIEVIRLPLKEIYTSMKLDTIKDYCDKTFNKAEKINDKLINIPKALYESSISTKVQYAILLGLEKGWIKENNEWNLEIEGTSSLSLFAIKDLLNMIINLGGIYNIDTFPSKVKVKIGDNLNIISTNQDLSIKSISNDSKHFEPNLRICVDHNKSIFHKVTNENEPSCPDIIIRPTYLPVPLRIDSIFSGERIVKDKIKENIDKKSLQVFLMNIFRKRNFRDQQDEAIINILSHKDSAVLLPTGAGKSIIYQLAGMLMPGITAIIDPIVALIEDQVHVLKSHGISRAAPIKSDSAEAIKDILARAEMGEFYFMFFSPERLQSPKFRETLLTLKGISLINLAVIDEAHCVSEWGHNFRPAYLNLSNNIKEHMQDSRGFPPPVVALTGTASRAVLKDIMTELELNKLRDPVIKPKSFDRNELNYWIKACKFDKDIKSIAKAVFDELPKKFGVSRSDLYSTNGNRTFSGLAFSPNVNGEKGITSYQKIVQNITSTSVGIFSGSPVKGFNKESWDETKSRHALDFKENKTQMLVATKAFGMGIDKSNIRYTIHFGIPSSLESFYQEAGRAGRNRKESHCGIIFTEFDKNRTDSLLDETVNFETLKKNYERIGRANPDDIMRQLYFHVINFPGVDDELNNINLVLDTIKDLDNSNEIEIPRTGLNKGDDDKNMEKAIHRLVRIGFVNDYEVDYGSSKFIVYSCAFDFDSSKERLLDYIQSAQPGVIKFYNDKVDNLLKENDSKKLILSLSKILIEFTYDVIEKGRRTALKQMINLARVSTNDSDIRERILAYLSEGVSFQKIIELIENPNIEKILPNVFKIVEDTDEDDYFDLRGEVERNLVDYPDHPALVLIKAVTEIIISNDEDIGLRELATILSKESSSSRSRYALKETDVYYILNWLVSFGKNNSETLLRVTAYAYYKAIKNSHITKSDEFERKLRELNVSIINMIEEVCMLGSKVDLVIDYHDLAKDKINYNNIKETIGG
jgi:ATP-dependent DNA helicase RecQ